jgi:hypothetical protein
MAVEMLEPARTYPGFIAMKEFKAEDGERLTVVWWENDELQAAWRRDERHRVAPEARSRALVPLLSHRSRRGDSGTAVHEVKARACRAVECNRCLLQPRPTSPPSPARAPRSMRGFVSSRPDCAGVRWQSGQSTVNFLRRSSIRIRSLRPHRPQFTSSRSSSIGAAREQLQCLPDSN